MFFSRSSHVALALLLLLASIAGQVGHDHGLQFGPEGYECSLDHKGEGLSPQASVPSWHESGDQHHHSCFACPLHGQRSWAASAGSTETILDPLQVRLRYRSEFARSAQRWIGWTLRGPPLV